VLWCGNSKERRKIIVEKIIKGQTNIRDNSFKIKYNG
jgi:hypothetical protein